MFSARGNMTAAPRNAVVLAGDRAELKCRVDRSSTVNIIWEITKYSRLVTNKSTLLKMESIARFDKNVGLVDLNISHLLFDVDNTGSGIIYYNSTELEDAGIYNCRALIGSESIVYSAQLIVLGEYHS